MKIHSIALHLMISSTLHIRALLYHIHALFIEHLPTHKYAVKTTC